MSDPFGQTQFVVPQLFSYVGDEPELKDVLCIKGGNTAYPCELCCVHSSQLSHLKASKQHRFPPREQADQVSFIVSQSRVTLPTVGYNGSCCIMCMAIMCGTCRRPSSSCFNQPLPMHSARN